MSQAVLAAYHKLHEARSAIEHMFQSGNMRSPLTNEPLASTNLFSNRR